MNKKVSLNSDKGILTVGDVETRLTNKEFDLFRELHDNIGSTVNRSVVLKKIWFEDDYHNARSMDVYRRSVTTDSLCITVA